MTKFEVGVEYDLRTYGDGDECHSFYRVKARTAKFVTLTHHGKTTRHGVYTFGGDGVERCRPWGSYSMAPVLCADRRVTQ